MVHSGASGSAFPVESLPPWLAFFVEREAIATQTPVDLAAVLGLATISTAVARKAEIQLKDGYTEPLNLYAVVALPPGNRSRMLTDCFY